MSNSPTSYSLSQRVLHWGMALLIFFNLIFTDGMEHYHRLVARGEPTTPDDVAGANIHAYVGIAILALAVLRIILRFVQGAPALPEDEPALGKLVAKATHGLLYLLILLMPISGIAAYYGGVGIAGEAHAEVLKVVMWALIVLHVAGALVQQYYFKTNSLQRMTRGA